MSKNLVEKYRNKCYALTDDICDYHRRKFRFELGEMVSTHYRSDDLFLVVERWTEKWWIGNVHTYLVLNFQKSVLEARDESYFRKTNLLKNEEEMK